MTKMSKRFMTLLSAACLAWAATPAQAVVAQQSFTISGICSDCGGQAVSGTLVLQNYTFGDNFNYSNFFSFTYSGSNKTPGFTWVQTDMQDRDDSVSGYFRNDPNSLDYLVNLVKAPLVKNGPRDFFVGPTTVFDPNDPNLSLGTYDFNLGVINLNGGPKTKDYGFATWTTVLPDSQGRDLPEPGSLMLAGAALAALGLSRRRKA